MIKKKPKLLSPAGDLDRLKAAFEYGADAVYAGVPEFGMRVREIGFDLGTIAKGVEFAHKIGKEVYITVNIFAKNCDLKKLPKFLKKLSDIKPDALIVADPGVIEMIELMKINIPIHLSTQANVTNWSSVNWWAKRNVEQIVLARELSYQEIGEIRKKNKKIPLEIFVHGALCMSYSGRCNISNYLSGRDANHGECNHCCRWEYDVYLEEKGRVGQLMKVEQNKKGSYFFNSKDLCLIGMIPEILDTGVNTLKIEGRNKSIYYVCAVTRAYRKALDLAYDDVKLYKKYLNDFYSELMSVGNRDYTTGFFGGDQSSIVNFDNSSITRNKEFVGQVLSFKDGYLKILAKNQIKESDKLEVMTNYGDNQFKIIELLDSKKKPRIFPINTNNVFYFKIANNNLAIGNYALIRKIVD